MLVVAFRNYQMAEDRLSNVTLYAVRVISFRVTFYRATFTPAYLDEITAGLPTTNIRVERFPQVNGLRNGFDLTNAIERGIALKGTSQLLI